MNASTINLLPITLAVALAACNSMSGSRTESATDSHTSQNSLDWAEAYGNDSILVTISDKQTYTWEERIDADSIHTVTGTLSWDTDGKNIILSGIDRTYQVGENALIPVAGARNTGHSAPLNKKSPVLGGVSWKLEELNEKQPSDFGQEPVFPAHLVFDEEKNRVAGSSGCNRIFGPYTTGKNPGEIKFDKLGGTMMMCGSMELERAFTSAIGAVSRYEIQHGKLLLLDKDGKTLFRFTPSLSKS